MKKWLFPVLFVFLFMIIAQAEEGGYIVMPHNEDVQDSALIDSSGADSTVSFWELPLWIQITYISGLLLATFGIFKLFPIFLAKVRGILENKNRQNIYAYIMKNPGCSAAEITNDLCMNRGTVKYHLQRLHNANKIIIIDHGKIPRFFQSNSVFGMDEILVASVLRKSSYRRVLLAVVENPGITNDGISHLLNLSKSTVSSYFPHISKPL